MHLKADARERSGLPSASVIRPKPGAGALEAEVIARLLDIEKHLAYHDGLELDQVTVLRTDGGWLFRVKAYGKRLAWVAWSGGASYTQALRHGADDAADAMLDWRLDDYPSKHAKRVLSEDSG